jgi:hypothetical protein
MGACFSAKTAMKKKEQQIISKSTLAIKEMTKVSEIYDRISQVGTFDCRITSLLTLHNHMVIAREKKDASNLLVFDVSDSLQVLQSNDIKVCFTETTSQL